MEEKVTYGVWGGLLRVESIVMGPLKENCYIVHDGSSGLIIDPGWPVDSGEVIGRIEDLGIRVVGIVATHGHFDHVLGVYAVKSSINAPFMMNGKDLWLLDEAPLKAKELFGIDAPPVPRPDRLLQEADTIDLGRASFTVIETPGHTPGSITLYSPSRVAFTGDTLFRGTIGRTDLPGGSPESMASSLRKLASLPDDTRVYPGHGPPTLIGEEKRVNPYVKVVLG